MTAWRGFGSDNHSGVHPEVLAAIAEANVGHAHAYGDDPWTVRATAALQMEFGENSQVAFVFNGTGANVVCALGDLPAVGERHLRRERAHRHRRVRARPSTSPTSSSSPCSRRTASSRPSSCSRR